MNHGGYTANLDQHVTVFIIGMRINKWWAVHKWLPVFMAMPKMIRELYTQKEYGFLSMQSYFGLRTTLMVQYWRSNEELIAYARDTTHLKAWKDFNRKTRHNDAVGIYHETYNVGPGSYECVYRNMPIFGLANAVGNQKITPDMNTAKKRLHS
ncbi:DUF4188 domain-containing protein [Virgibacillus sp. 179-BFC.A HS]|uniref:DUF4188 domain-containing protein n=1 Tax=Tigheibacillus jepli TaxID=3035914 RepID=A0ABU5CFU0_9BACI|nr:DUF4188 domain-containing protein [Virgibacillus sp. 179-BFC.A HS]MDY0405182.1 DUF4188 domain-containing protein [Virgibacillus sp. 179-BFC.A HS]